MKIYLFGLYCSLSLLYAEGQREFNMTDNEPENVFLARLNQAIAAQGRRWRAKVDQDFAGMTPQMLDEQLTGVPSVGRSLDYRSRLTRKPHDPIIAGKGRRRKQQQQVLPESFDYRTERPDCRYIGTATDQQECGSCWAVSSAAVISDRHCIFTGQNRLFSAAQLVACEKESCGGHWPADAMAYYVNYGLVSGGDTSIGQEAGCQPYPKSFTKTPNCNNPDSCIVPPRCTGECTNSTRDFWDDVVKGGDYYEINSGNITEIMQELYDYGPIVATLNIKRDFTFYSSGIYEYTLGNDVGAHAVKLIGWGTEQGIPYWLVVNSWGTNWGENGLFKIRRGNNEVAFEDDLTAVFPEQAFT